jgi:hypothetical protein
MTRRNVIAALLIGGAAFVMFFTPTGELASQSIRQVIVTNFPIIQSIEGEVSVTNPVRLSKLIKVEDVIVAPVKPTETTRLVEAGTLVTDGFPKVVLSLHGEVKGSVLKSGEVGVILIPDEPTIQEAFNEQGLVHFALRAAASGVSSSAPYFASNQPQYTVGFQSYRILLYNTTDKTITANLYAYLTN